MKFVHGDLSGEIVNEQKECVEWIIEAPELFAKYVGELYRQINKSEGKFVLSENNKEIDIAKHSEIIINPLSVEINNKKIVNKLYEELNKLSSNEVLYMKTLELTKLIQEYLLSLEQETNYILEFNNEVEMSALFKAVDLKYEDSEEDFLERFVKYIKTLGNLLSIKLVIFINARCFMNDEKIRRLCEEIKYMEIKGLFIENSEKACVEGMERYIIDKDRCEIY
jgi:CRISPR-associated protein Csn2